MTHHILQTDGARLSVTDTGGADPTLVFLHYWGGSCRTWAPVIECLAGTARCIAVDQRGLGESRATDGRYDLQAMADDVLSVIDRLALRRHVLVGHSMGGKVAQIVAARHPRGLAGLVLVAPAPPTPLKMPPYQRASMLESYQTRAGVLQALSVLAGSALPDSLRDQVIDDTLRGAAGAKRPGRRAAWWRTSPLSRLR
jgi:3-oxoadipate enol-lactonase